MLGKYFYHLLVNDRCYDEIITVCIMEAIQLTTQTNFWYNLTSRTSSKVSYTFYVFHTSKVLFYMHMNKKINKGSHIGRKLLTDKKH